MFKKIILSALFIPVISTAQIGDQIIKQINKFNEGTPSATTGSNPCGTCAEQKTARSMFFDCVNELCRNKFLPVYTAIPFINPMELNTPVPHAKEVEALLVKLENSVADSFPPEHEQKMDDLLKNKKLVMTNDDLDLFLQVLTFRLASLSIGWDPMTLNAFLDEGKFAQLQSQLPLSKKNQDLLKKKALAFAADLPNAKELMSMNNANPDIYLGYNYPGLKKDEAVKALIKDLRQEYKNYSESSIGKLLAKMSDDDTFYPQELLAVVESGHDIKNSDVADLIAAKKTLWTTAKFYSAGASTGKGKADYSDLRSQLVNPDRYERYKQAEKKKDAERKANQDTKSRCMSNYDRNMRILPSQDQVDKLKAGIIQVKSDIKTKWAPQYSEQTQKHIAEYLKEVDFLLPPSTEEYSKDLQARLVRKTQENSRKSATKFKDYNSLGLIHSILAYSEDIPVLASQGGYGEADSKICQTNEFAALIDANYTMLGKIQLSYTVAHQLEMGKGVVAHELGHGISQILRSGKASEHSAKRHEEFMSCLSGLHDQNGSQYAEEDYADWLSANVTQTNMGCINPLGSYWSGEKQIADDPEYTHSSDFFRLLHIESIQRGKLPDSCNGVLVEEGTPKDFMACQKMIDTKAGTR